jgi:Tfp pilus assembly protein PilF
MSMTLNITCLARRVIFQSGDFRLTDAGDGSVIDYPIQKQLVVSRFEWTALVAFCGVAHTGDEYVADWLVRQVQSTSMWGSFDESLGRLRQADSWLERFRLDRDRAFTISIGAFVKTTPVFVLISNFERLDRPPPADGFDVSDRLAITQARPRGAAVRIAGRPNAVTAAERAALLALLRSRRPPAEAYDVLASVNESAAARDSSISPGCYVSHVTLINEWGGRTYGWPEDTDFISLSVPIPGLETMLRRAVDESGRAKPLKVQPLGGVSAVDSPWYFRTALRERPRDPHILNRYGLYLAKRGKRDKAADAYRQVIAAMPEFALAHNNYANLLWETGDLDGARHEYQRALESDSQSPIVLGNYATFRWSVDDEREEARSLFDRALAVGRTARELAKLGRLLSEGLGDNAGARAAFEEALTLEPTHENALVHFAEHLWLREGRIDGASRHFHKATASKSASSQALAQHAKFEILAPGGDRHEGAGLARRLVKGSPEHPGALEVYALALTRTGELATAERLYREMLEKKPENAALLVNLSQILLAEPGREDTASELLERALTATGDRSIELEAWFYRFAHRLTPRADARARVEALLADGVRSPGWDFSSDVRAASVRSDPEAAGIERLAAAITAGSLV